MKPIKIYSLSCFLSWDDHKSIDALTRLLIHCESKRRQPANCHFFSSSFNLDYAKKYAWIKGQYLLHNQFINKYKLGQISTENFLTELEKIFKIKEEEIPAASTDTYCYHENTVLNALAVAFNAGMALKPGGKEYFDIVCNEEGTKNFAVNSCDLNIKRACQLLEITLEENTTDPKLKIIKGANELDAYLCTSYRYKTFRTMQEVYCQESKNNANIRFVLEHKEKKSSCLGYFFPSCCPSLTNRLIKECGCAKSCIEYAPDFSVIECALTAKLSE